MDWSTHLTGFFKAVANDARMSPAHISLYMALFHLYLKNGTQNGVFFSSYEVMPLAKIDSRATYHKCLRDLVECGYIEYVPSYNPFLKNLAYLKEKQ